MTTVLCGLMSIMCFMLIGRPSSSTHTCTGMHTGAPCSLICLYALHSVPASCELLISQSSPVMTPVSPPFLLSIHFLSSQPASSSHSLRQAGRKRGKCSRCISVFVLMLEKRGGRLGVCVALSGCVQDCQDLHRSL